MSGMAAFTRKELVENVRTYRLFLMLALFFFFGVSSPLLAKFTPLLIETFAVNMEVTVKEPGAADAWMQFYKNVSSLGLSLMIILFSSCLSGEYAKGTLTIMFTKGLSRRAVVLSKFISSAVIMTGSYWLSFAVAWAYTAYLWPGEGFKHLLLSAFVVWLTALLYLCILMLGCVMFRQAFTAILFLLVFTVVMGLLSMTPLLEGVSPSFLVMKNVDLLTGEAAASQFILPGILTVILSAVLLLLSVMVFDRKTL